MTHNIRPATLERTLGGTLAGGNPMYTMDPTALILRSIETLSNKIETLSNKIDNRFEEVSGLVDRKLAAIRSDVRALDAKVDKNFLGIEACFPPLYKGLADIESDIRKLDEKVDKKFLGSINSL